MISSSNVMMINESRKNRNQQKMVDKKERVFDNRE